MENGYRDVLNLAVVVSDVTGSTGGDMDVASLPLVTTLCQTGHSVTVIYVRTRARSRIFLAQQTARFRKAGLALITIVTDKEPPLTDPRIASYRVYRWLKSHQSDFCIVYFPEQRGFGYFSLVAKRLGLAFNRLSLATYVSGPTIWAYEVSFSLPGSLDDVDCDFMEKECVRLSDWVITENLNLCDWMRTRNWVMPNRSSILPSLSTRVPPHNTTPGGPVSPCVELVFVGRLDLSMGLRLFCDAIDLLEKAQRLALRKITFIGKTAQNDRLDSAKFIVGEARKWGLSYRLLTNYNWDQTISYLSEPGRLAVVVPLSDSACDTISACLHRAIPFVATGVGRVLDLIHPEDHGRVLCAPYPAALAARLRQTLRDGMTIARCAEHPKDTLARWVSLQSMIKALPEPLPVQHTSPLVTVCLVHHDRPVLLRKALDSLRAQTYRNLEVVLVDDGSRLPEATRYLKELEADFDQLGWRIVRQENRYPGAARNCAARHARGEYLLFMDDDNVAKRDEIEVLVQAAETSGAAVLVPIVDRFVGDDLPTTALNQWIPLGGSIAAGVCRNGYGDTNALWRREVFESVSGFTEEYAVGNEDWELLANAALSGYESYVVPEPLLWYRVSPGGIQVGVNEVYYARSVRPYVRHDPDGLGALLAYSLNLHLRTQAIEHARQGFWVRKVAKIRAYIKSIRELLSDAIHGWHDTH